MLFSIKIKLAKDLILNDGGPFGLIIHDSYTDTDEINSVILF